MQDKDRQDLFGIIRASFDTTFKEPSGMLKHPYLSPGGVYSDDLWDWDSYWTTYAMLGIAAKYKDKALREKIVPYARGIFFNFVEHQGEDGSLPILMTPRDDDWFDCRKSPGNNMAKPFFAQLALLLMNSGILDENDMKEGIYNIRRFHVCYRRRFQHPGTGLVFWGSDLGIGVDDDPTAWGRPRNSCGSLFLNSFLYREYLAAEELAENIGRPDYAEEYRTLAKNLRESVRKYCWDPREKAYFSVDLQCHENLYPHRHWGILNGKLTPFWQCLKLKVLSWTSILPLWAGIGTEEELKLFIGEHFTAERLMSDYGVRSLSKDEPMYAPEVARGNPSNWLGPVWILVNYLVWETLSEHNCRKAAKELSEKNTALLSRDLRENGCIHEYYSPETGRGVTNPDFMSWNALAALM